MKTFLLLLLAAATVLAEPPVPVEPAIPPAEAPGSKPAAAEGWSVVGVWDCNHRDWDGPLTLKADGAIQGKRGLHTGRWTLAARQDRIVLVLRWDDWPAETVTMLSADEFHGDADQGDLRMHRRRTAPMPGGSGQAVVPSVEFRCWSQGEPPAKLIRADEGFCALTHVQGNFQGGGESVQVRIAEDGYWYLDGTSQQEGVGAECIVVRYPVKPPAGQSGKN